MKFEESISLRADTVLSAQSTLIDLEERIANSLSVVNGVENEERKRQRHGDESSKSVDDARKNCQNKSVLGLCSFYHTQTGARQVGQTHKFE